MTISVVILTRNEAKKNIERCLRSVQWADETVVVDAESTNGTPEIAQGVSARVIIHPWEGVGEQVDFAISQVKGDWILIVDTDEEVSPQLAEAIRKVTSSEQPFVAYQVLRIERLLGHWLKHGGFFPHYELRLFKRGHVRHESRPVHRKAYADGPVGRLNAPLFHYPAEDLADWWLRNLRRTRIEAEWDFINGKKFSPLAVFDALMLWRKDILYHYMLCLSAITQEVYNCQASLFA